MNVAFLDPCVAAAKINALRPPPEPMSMCALYQGAMAKDKRLPIAFAVVYESGVALFRSAWLGLGVLAATVTAAAFAPGHGGSYKLLAQPGTVDRYVQHRCGCRDRIRYR